jgi:hypothetical protein
MLRAILVVIACISLSACSGWMSDERLFEDGDWAQLNLNGPYKDQSAAADDMTKRVTLRTRPDGIIEGTGRDPSDGFVIGLVPIRGGSGDFFLMVDRSDPSREGDDYYIARLIGGGTLAFYLPDCSGTSPVEGMEKVSGREEQEPAIADGDAPAIEERPTPPDRADDSVECKFSTKDALMAAGLEAERFLATKHVVAVAPFAALEPVATETIE